jgi:hypothetical protein
MMGARQATFVACLAILVYHGSLNRPQSVLAEAPSEQSVCCGARQIALQASKADPQGKKAKSKRITPRLKPAELRQLRLPDVRITSATHHKANKAVNVNNAGRRLGPIGVAHVDVEGLIGGTIRTAAAGRME